MPVGLVMYGWTAQYKTLWIGPDVGVAILAMGTIIGFQCIQGFLVDTYTRYAASAVAAGTVLRSLAGFGFPLFAPSLYARLGYGWGNTLLAFVGVAIGWSGPILLVSDLTPTPQPRVFLRCLRWCIRRYSRSGVSVRNSFTSFFLQQHLDTLPNWHLQIYHHVQIADRDG